MYEEQVQELAPAAASLRSCCCWAGLGVAGDFQNWRRIPRDTKSRVGAFAPGKGDASSAGCRSTPIGCGFRRPTRRAQRGGRCQCCQEGLRRKPWGGKKPRTARAVSSPQDNRKGGRPTLAEIDKILDAANRALRTAPLDSRALRILAQLADVSGDKDRKERLLAAIVSRTKHEPLAGYWLMLEALERKDFVECRQLRR